MLEELNQVRAPAVEAVICRPLQLQIPSTSREKVLSGGRLDRRLVGDDTMSKGRKQKQPAIIRQLRDEIVSGHWQPGQRLPSREEFQESTGVSRVTLQKIFDKLVREGFIEVFGRRETRVAEDLPHLSRYVLAFPGNPSTPRWSRFWTTLSDASLNFRRKDGSPAVEILHNVDGHTDVREYTRLLTIARHNLAVGVICLAPSPLLLETPLLKEPAMPTVLIAQSPSLVSDPHLATVTPHTPSFYQKACGYLKSKGCKNIAMIIPHGENVPERVLPALKQNGLKCPEYWLHEVWPQATTVVTSLVQLLMRNADERPDGMIIADDHFAQPAVLGLLKVGTQFARTMPVVVHENFPSKSEQLLPFKRLGFNVERILQTCISALDAQRRDKVAPPHLLVEAVFEE